MHLQVLLVLAATGRARILGCLVAAAVGNMEAPWTAAAAVAVAGGVAAGDEVVVMQSASFGDG